MHWLNSQTPPFKQVEIEAVSRLRKQSEEKGFDWLLGPFKVGSKEPLGLAGLRNGTPVDAANFPFVDAGNPVGFGTSIPGMAQLAVPLLPEIAAAPPLVQMR
jgi:hypothetical protein